MTAGQVRVYELARELNIEARELLTWLSDNGAFAGSASSILEASVVRHVRTALTPPPPGSPAASSTDEKLRDWLVGSKGSNMTPRGSGRFASASAQPPGRPRWPGLVGTPRGRHGSPQTPVRPGLADAERHHHQEEADARDHVRAWARHWFTPEATLAWRAAGLRPSDAQVAIQCVTFGLRPTDLARRVDGQRAGGWLRSGESVTSVLARLRQQSGE